MRRSREERIEQIIRLILTNSEFYNDEELRELIRAVDCVKRILERNLIERNLLERNIKERNLKERNLIERR